MKTHTLVQGSPEWSAHRRQFFNASDAPAMMGCSAYKTRDQLLHEMHTGLTKEVDAATQRRFADGHRFEALARPLAVKIIGEQLFPVVGSEGKLSASFDGLTMGEDTAFEHKSLNDELRAAIPEGDLGAGDSEAGGALPLQYRVQMEQQLMVSGAERVLFMASKWAGDELVEERHCWYESDPALRVRILAGWEQFDADLCAYTPPAAAPVVVAEPVQALPAVLVQVQGEITVTHNFGPFEVALRDFLEHRLIRAPKTDQDFADLDVQIKAMKGAEAALEGSEVQMVAQVQPIDQAKKTKDMLLKLTRDNRLMAEKLLASEKERRRTEIVTNPAKDLREYIASLNRELGAPYIPMPAVDFAAAIKGMRSLSSMEDAVATRLANAKIDANAVAATVRVNLKTLDALGAEFALLFADKNQLVLKAEDDFKAIATNRVDAHKAEVARKEEALRETLRLEEEAKAAAAGRAALAKIQGIQNQLQAAQGAKPAVVRQILADTEAVVVDLATFGVHNDLAIDAKRQTVDALKAMVFHPNGAPRYSTTMFRDDGEPIMLNDDGTRSIFCDLDEGAEDAPAVAAARDQAVTGTGMVKTTVTQDGAGVPVVQVERVPPANVVPMRAAAAPAPAAAPSTPPTMKLGDINAMLAPIQLSVDGLTKLGFPPAATQQNAKLYHHSDLTNICAALHDLLDQVQAKQAA